MHNTDFMPPDERFDREPALPQPASQAGLGIPDDCRAARIGDVTAFAQCFGETTDNSDPPAHLV